MNLSPVERSFGFSAFSKKILSRVLGRGVCLHAFLYICSFNSSGLSVLCFVGGVKYYVFALSK